MLQLCLLKWQDKHSTWETDNIKQRAGSQLSPGTHGDGEQGGKQHPGAHLSMVFGAEMCLFAAVEHTQGSTVLSRVAYRY